MRGIAQALTTRFRGRQCGLGARADGLTLCFRHDGEHSYSEAVRPWDVDGDELDASIAQREQEGRVAGQPIELSYYERRTVDAAGGERLGELGPIIPLARLDFDELPNETPGSTIEEVSDRLPLRF
jgi:hypothetical protein